MVKANLFKHLRAALSVVLLSGSLLILDSCNNKSSEEKENKDSTTMEHKDTTPAMNTSEPMPQDTTVKDTTKGEQVPPPK